MSEEKVPPTSPSPTPEQITDERLQLALDAARMGSFMWYPAEDRSESDARMMALFGLPTDGDLTLSAALSAIIHPADRERYGAAVMRSIAGEGDGDLYEEIRVIHPDGSLRWVAVTARSTLEGGGDPQVRMAGVAVDITERKHAEEALRQSEERQSFLLEVGDALRPLLDSLEIQAQATRLLGEHLRANRIFYAEVEADEEHAIVEHDYTYNTASFVGRHRLNDFGPSFVEHVRAGKTLVVDDIHRGYLDEAEQATFAFFLARSLVVVPLIKEGRLVGALAVTKPEAYAWRPHEVALVEETAERTWAAVERARAEAALRLLNEQLETRVAQRTAEVRRLVNQLTMSEQEERRRISSILHDDLQQRLFSLLFQIHLLRDSIHNADPNLPSGGEADLGEGAEILAQIEEELQRSVQITRELSVDFSPPILYNEGLVETMRWLANRMKQQHGLEVVVLPPLWPEEAIPLLAEDLRVLLFQLVRELLFNVVKHANVKRVAVALSHGVGVVRIEVSDQGKGFAIDEVASASLENEGLEEMAASANRQNSQGLQRIRQRLQLLGGRMEIASTPGEGTRISLYTPI